MENVLTKIIKIVSGEKGGGKDYWVDDSKSKTCYECDSAFSQWNRRHHCRICGRVFCGNCTRNSIPPPRDSADQQWLRVCNFCYRVRQRSDTGAGRTQQQHAIARGPGGAVLTKTGSLRQLLDPVGSLSSTSSDGSRRGGSAGRGWGRSQSCTHRVTSGDLSWTVPPPLEDDFGMSLADRDARLLFQQQREAGTLPQDAAVQANSLWEVHRHVFVSAADLHLRSVVQQLLEVEAVPHPELWAPIVSAAAQGVAAYLSPPQMYGNGQHDPRQALKVKKVADVGRPEDTCVVTGVVVRKGLVHRKMRSYIEYPKVLLLAGSLEYQRETNKLSSFDLMDHDKQYLANAVARLAVVKPDVVLVEGSVARMAQEDLLARNISVAQKIKSKVLERLARCMGVRVAPTVEHLTAATAHLYLGDCKVFRVEAETVVTPTASPGPGPSPGQGTAAAAGAADAPPSGTGTGLGTATEGQPSAAAEAVGDVTGSGCGSTSGGTPPLSTSPLGAQQQQQQQQPSLAPPPAPPPPPLQQQPGYTSLSAAMMMKALGSGPNAAAAVACVSGGSGVAASVAAVAVHSAAGGASAASAVAVATTSSSSSASAAATGAKPSAGAAASGGPAAAAGQGQAGASVRPGALAIPPPPAQVTLMYFEGCRPTTATVLLKGAGTELLRRLKPVVGFAVLTAWNQRLEAAFLTDLLTAAVAAAGEEAYAAHAHAVTGGAGVGVSSTLDASPTLMRMGSLTLSGFSAAAAPPPPPLPPLSLACFRAHAEAAVRASVAAASASGAPGILLSISPHCNAWDDSLVAEWEQQGFTFPHLHPSQVHYLHPYHHNLHQQQQALPAASGGAGGACFGASGQQPPPTAAATAAALANGVVAAVRPPVGGEAPQPSQQGAFGDAPASAAGEATAAAAQAAAATAPGTTSDALDVELTLKPDSADGQSGGGGGTRSESEPRVGAAGAATADSDASGGSSPVTLAPPATSTATAVGTAPSAMTLSSPFAALGGASGDAPSAPGAAATTARRASTSGPGPAAAAAGGGEGAVPAGSDATAEQQQQQQQPGALASAGEAGQAAPGTTHVDGAAGTAGGSAPNASTTEATSEAVPAQAGAAAAALAGSAAGATAAAAATSGPVSGPANQPPPGHHHQHHHLQQHPYQQQQSALRVLQGQRIYNHQRIFVTCMFRRSRDRNLCDPFQVKQIDYYHRSSDVPLIRYIKMCTQMGWTCPGAGCPEPFTAHESVFFFGGHKLTIFYSTLPPIQALPGEEKNQIWHWTRPIGRGREGAASCRRVPLSQDACYISMGRFLELSFSADGLDVFGRSLHYDHVRYFGLGRTLVCMFPERTSVYVMQLPDVIMSYSQAAQCKWLRQEASELLQEAKDAFGVIEITLRESPYYGATTTAVVGSAADVSAAAAAEPSPSGASAADAGFTPGSSPPGSAASGAAHLHAAMASGGSGGAASASLLSQLLFAVQRDYSSFHDLVTDCLARNTAPVGGGNASPLASAAATAAAGAVPWDEQLVSGLRELNRLRAVLAKAVLQWAARLQDPAGFAAQYSRVSGAGYGPGRVSHVRPYTHSPSPFQPAFTPAGATASASQLHSATGPAPPPAAAVPPSGPFPSAAPSSISDLPTGAPSLGTSSYMDLNSSFMSDGSVSLFAATPAAAAIRLGLVSGLHAPLAAGSSVASSVQGGLSHGGASVAASDAGGAGGPGAAPASHCESLEEHASDTTSAHALPIPIVPSAHGPLSVAAIAEMVAQLELRGGGAELLEGSRALLSGGGAGGPASAAASRPNSSRALLRRDGGGGSAAAAGASGAPAGGSIGGGFAAAGTSSIGGAGGAATPPSADSPLAAAGGHLHPLAPHQAGIGTAGGAPAGGARGGGGVPPQGPLVTSGSTASHQGGRRVSGSGARVSIGGGMDPLAAGIAGIGAGGGGGGGGPKGTSLPRSASVSTIGDLADMSYMGGLGGDSGAEDHDEGGDEDADDEEEPDHDTFLAFMGSSPQRIGAGFPRSGGPGSAAAVGGGGGRGIVGGDAAGRSAGGGRGRLTDDGGDEDSEVADGAYYYRALFSHGAGGHETGDEGLQPPSPRGSRVGAGAVVAAAAHDTAPYGAPAGGALMAAAAAASTTGAPGPGGMDIAAIRVGMVTVDVLGAPSHPPPPQSLLPATEPLAITSTAVPDNALGGGGGTAAAAASSALPSSAALAAGSRRQLLLNVRRRLEPGTASLLSGASLARCFIPLPGRATLPPGVNDTVIPVFDSEPTSIIAYALCTRSFQQQVNAGYKAIFGKARSDSAAASAAAASAGPSVREAPHPHPHPHPPLTEQSPHPLPPPLATPAAAPPSDPGAGVSPVASTTGTPTAGGGFLGAAAAVGGGAGAAAPAEAPLPPPPPPPSSGPAASGPAPSTFPGSSSAAAVAAASPDADWWTVLTSREACHVRVSFEDEARTMPWARAKFSVVAHFAPQFAELRRRCIQGGEAAFIASMCRCKRWESRGGKSNAYFAKTRDDRYIVKSLSKSEKASFMNFAPHYFSHMGRHLLNRDAPTCLAKILGVYSVTFKPQPGSAGLDGGGGGGGGGGAPGAGSNAALIKELKDREFSQDLLVMENCFYDRPVARIYDLKGSERNRFNADAASRPEDRLEVHLDDNLRRTTHTNPIFVDARSRHEMERAVWADTTFLAGQDVMDYSLLVGVDKENGVLALAIIDFIRQYTWDKQLETWVKSSGMLGGNGKEPTIISPKQYMRRFRAAMQQYFTAVPGSAGSEAPKDPDATT